ncbi:MAG: AraC family transcriptional regulator [Vallitaleaceae bacterium]|nr:AraC family transcriptional regulator [Vallitaleaceae bacterium]
MMMKKSYLPQGNIIVSDDYFQNKWNSDDQHRHPWHELFYLEEGELSFSVYGKLLHLKAGDLVLLRPGGLHYNIGKTSYRRFLIEFDEALLSGFLTAGARQQVMTCFQSEFLRFNEEEKKLFHLYKEQLLTLHRQAQDTRFVFSAMLSLLCQTSKRQIEDEYFKVPLITATDKLSEIFIYMHAHFAEIESIQDIASNFYLSPNYLSRLFKKESGLTVMEYLMQIRLAQACYLLSKSDTKIKDIATSCGFKDTDYFFRIFKKKKGLTPKAFRARSRASTRYD